MKTMTSMRLALAALLCLASCSGDEQLGGAIKDRTFEFTSETEHIEDRKATAIRLLLTKGEPGTEFRVGYVMDDDRNIMLETEDGKEFISNSLIRTDGRRAISLYVDDRMLAKGSHTLSLEIATEYWTQKLEVPFSVSYQPFEIRHTVSTAAENGTELNLELTRGDADAEYTVRCEIKGDYGYSITRKVVFPKDRKLTVSLPVIRPGSYDLSISIEDGTTRHAVKEKITEILRDRYRVLNLELSERPQGTYSVRVSENPYRIGLELDSRLTVNGSCEYDDVFSDRDGDWPWARIAYSEENSDSEPYRGVYSDEILELHDYESVIDAITSRTEQHCHFSECEGEFGYPSSCLTGYSDRHHHVDRETLRLNLLVSDPVEGVTVRISHDIQQRSKNSSVLLNGKDMEYLRAYDCEVKTDETK